MKKIIIFLFSIPLLCCVGAQKLAGVADVSLWQKYQVYFPIGAAINPSVDLGNAEREKFIANQYNSVTPENQMKIKQIHPQEKKFNWQPADEIVQFAVSNKMKVRGHALIWYQNVPKWMVEQNGSLADKKTLYKRMEEHITAVMSRYKNKVYCWDVVNEAISNNPREIFRPEDSLNMIAGEEYVEMAFRYARKADPEAQLFYNDYRFADPVKRQKIYELIRNLKAKGTPIDGVGMQSHYTPGEITAAYLQETIDMFAGLGVKVQVTELDVSVYDIRNRKLMEAQKNDDVYTPARQAEQQAMYSMLFEVYRKNHDKITGVTFWGTSDMRKNYRTNKIKKMDYPFLFDENMQPKKAFYSIINF